MAWVQYFWLWLSEASPTPVRIVEISFLILTLTRYAIRQYVPKWESAMSKIVWQLPLGLLIAVFIISLGVSSNSLYSKQQSRITDLETMTEYITDMQAVLREGTLVERKAFIRSFVKDVRVSGDEAVLTYTMPELPEKVSLGEAEVPRIVQRGGR